MRTFTEKYPDLLEDEVVGEQAKVLYQDAQTMLHQMIEEQWVTAKARFGLFPVNAVGEDIEIYSDENRSKTLGQWITLRQQLKKPKPNPISP